MLSLNFHQQVFLPVERTRKGYRFIYTITLNEVSTQVLSALFNGQENIQYVLGARGTHIFSHIFPTVSKNSLNVRWCVVQHLLPTPNNGFLDKFWVSKFSRSCLKSNISNFEHFPIFFTHIHGFSLKSNAYSFLPVAPRKAVGRVNLHPPNNTELRALQQQACKTQALTFAATQTTVKINCHIEALKRNGIGCSLSERNLMIWWR